MLAWCWGTRYGHVSHPDGRALWVVASNGWGGRIPVASPGLPSHTQRKSLRERWLMDGVAEGTERPEEPASKDPQSPEGQAQARIRNLEDSLFS